MVDYVQRNRAHLEPTSPTRPPEFWTLEYWRTRVQACLDEFQRDQSVVMSIFLLRDPAQTQPNLDGVQTKRLIGTVSLTAIQRGPLQAANLGYSLDAAFQGQGFMHEAASATIQYAFGPLNLHRLFAAYAPTNERSARVLRRLGFDVIGYCRDYLHINGRWEDHVLTSLLNPAYH